MKRRIPEPHDCTNTEIDTKEVTGGSGHIEEKKVEMEEEMKVVRVYAVSRAGHHTYLKMSKTSEPMNGECTEEMKVYCM